MKEIVVQVGLFGMFRRQEEIGVKHGGIFGPVLELFVQIRPRLEFAQGRIFHTVIDVPVAEVGGGRSAMTTTGRAASTRVARARFGRRSMS